MVSDLARVCCRIFFKINALIEMESSIDDLFGCFDEAVEDTVASVPSGEAESVAITEE